MSAIYIIDGKPHELCTCSNLSDSCPRGAKRPMQTAGYGQCLVPCQGIVIPVGEPAPQPAQGAAPASLSEFVHAPDSARERIGESVIDGAIKAQNAKIAAPASDDAYARARYVAEAKAAGAEPNPNYSGVPRKAPASEGETPKLPRVFQILVDWENVNGTLAAIMEPEYAALVEQLRDASIAESPRMAAHAIAIAANAAREGAMEDAINAICEHEGKDLLTMVQAIRSAVKRRSEG